MMRKIKEYQTGSKILSPDRNVNQSVDRNQLKPVNQQDLEDPFADLDELTKPKKSGFVPALPDIDTGGTSDTLDIPQQENVDTDSLEQSSSPDTAREAKKIKPYDPDDPFNDLDEIIRDRALTKEKKITDTFGNIRDPQRLKDITNLFKTDSDLRGIDASQIEFDVPPPLPFMLLLSSSIKQYPNSVRRAKLPDGREILFAEQNLSNEDEAVIGSINTIVGGTSGFGQGVIGIMEVLSNGVKKFLSGAVPFIGVNPLVAKEVSKKYLSPAEGTEAEAAGLLYTPFSHKFRDWMNTDKIQLAKDEDYIQSEARILAKKKELDKKFNNPGSFRNPSGAINYQLALFREPEYWNRVFSAEFYNSQMVEGIESAVSFLTPGIAVSKLGLATKLFRTVKPGVIGKLNFTSNSLEKLDNYAKGLDMFTGAYAMAALEGTMEASHNSEADAVEYYNSLIDPISGATPIRTLVDLEKEPDSQIKQNAIDRYRESYSDIYNANVATLTLMNMVPLATLMGKSTLVGRLGAQGAKFARTQPRLAALSDLSLNFMSESTQEVIQTGIQNYEKAKLDNGLYPGTKGLLESIWGTGKDVVYSAQRGFSDLGRDVETTDAWLLGGVLGFAMTLPSVSLKTAEQLAQLKDLNKLSKEYPESDFTSFFNIIDSKGNVNIPELAGKLKNLNKQVVNEQFLQATQEYGSKELADYAYQQSISGFIYDALKANISQDNIRDRIENILTNSIDTEAVVPDVDGEVKPYSEIVQDRLGQVDKIIKDYNVAARTAKIVKLPEEMAKANFHALIGTRYFNDVYNDLATRLDAVNEKIKKQIARDAPSRTKEEIELLEKSPNKYDALFLEFDDISEPLKVLKAEANELRGKISQVVDVLGKYRKTQEILTRKDVVKDAISEERKKKVDEVITRAIAEDTTEKSIQAGAKELSQEDLLDEDSFDLLEDAVAEKNKEREEELEFTVFPTESRKLGATMDGLTSVKNVEPWEKEIRANLAAKQLQIQRNEAATINTSERYLNRPLLLEDEILKSRKTLETPEIQNVIALSLAEAKGRTEVDKFIIDFLNKPLSEKLKDKDYVSVMSKVLTNEIVSIVSTETTQEDLTTATENLDHTEPPIPTEYDEDTTFKGENVGQDTEQNLRNDSINESLQEGIETPSPDEEARRDSNAIWVPHIKDITFDPTVEYTISKDEWEKAIAYLHQGLLKRGDVIQLEIEPGLSKNALDVSWENVIIQAVTYKNGDRIVVGHLHFYLLETATPSLKRIRQDIFEQWSRNKNSHLISDWVTVIQEIKKGHVERQELAEGTFRDTDLSTYPSVAEAITWIDQTIDDIEYGTYTGTQEFKTPISTNGVPFRTESNRQTIDPLTGTGFGFLLIKSQKSISEGNYWETIPIFTKRIKDIEGYRERIIELIDNADLSSVLRMVRWEVGPRRARKRQPHFAVQNGVAVIKDGKGNILYQGGEQIYKYYEDTFDINNKPIQIDPAWFSQYADDRPFVHPFFKSEDPRNPLTLKEFIFKHATVTSITQDSVHYYTYNDKTVKSFFHSAGVYVAPFSQSEGIKVVESTPISNVDPKPTAPKIDPTEKINKPLLPITKRPKLKVGTPDFVYENEKKSRRWFKERFEEIGYKVDDDVIAKFHGLLRLKNTEKIFGIAKDAAVTLASRRPEGTTKHEAFHIVFNLFLTEKQRVAAFREAWNIYKNDPELKGYTEEDFEKALKEELFGTRKETKFSLSEKLAENIQHHNDVVRKSDLPDAIKKSLIISTKEYRPKISRVNPNANAISIVAGINDTNTTYDSVLAHYAVKIDDLLNLPKWADVELERFYHRLEGSVVGNEKFSPTKNDNVAISKAGNKFKLTSKFISFLESDLNRKIDLGKPFSASGISAYEKEALIKFYNWYVPQIEEFFKSKNKPVPKSIVASRLLQKYKDWLDIHYPIYHFKSPDQTFTYGLDSAIENDNVDKLRRGYEINISTGFLTKSGHTYKLSYTDETGSNVEIPDRWNTLGWYIYHELFGDIPLFYEFQSDIIDQSDASLNLLFNQGDEKSVEKLQKSLTSILDKTLRGMEDRVSRIKHKETDFKFEIHTRTAHQIRQNIMKSLGYKNLGVFKGSVNHYYNYDYPYRQRTNNYVGDEIENSIYKYTQKIKTYTDSLAQLLDIQYEATKHPLFLERKRFFPMKKALGEMLDLNDPRNPSYSEFSEDLFQSRVLKYLSAAQFENFKSYAQNFDTNIFSVRVAEQYYKDMRYYDKDTAKVTATHYLPGEKYKGKLLPIKDVIKEVRRRLEFFNTQMYYLKKFKDVDLDKATDIVNDYVNLQQARVMEFSEEYIVKLNEKYFDVLDENLKEIPRLLNSIDNAKSSLALAIEDLEKRNRDGVQIELNDPLIPVLEDLKKLRTHQLKLFITHAITYAREQNKSVIYMPTADFISKVESGNPWTLYVTPEDRELKPKFKESHLGSFYEALMEIPNISYEYVKPEGVNRHLLKIDISNVPIYAVERFSIEKSDGAKDYYKSQGILTILEEKMADAFAEFQDLDRSPDWLKKASPKLAKILNDLFRFLFRSYDILQQYFTDSRSIQDLYRQIDNNSLGRNFLGERRKSYSEILNKNISDNIDKNRELNPSNVYGFKIESIPPALIASRISYVNKDYINTLIYNEFKLRGHLLPGETKPTLYGYLMNQNPDNALQALADVYSKVKNSILNEEIPKRKAELATVNEEDAEAINDNISSLETLANLISIDYILGKDVEFQGEERDFTERLLLNLEEAQGVLIRGKRIVTHAESIKKAEEDIEDGSNDEDNSDTTEITDQIVDSSERWQINVLAEKSFEKLTPKLKALISNIPIINPATNEPLTTDLGGKVYYDARAVFNSLVSKISSNENVEMMKRDIDAYRGKDKKIEYLLKELITDPSLITDLWLGIGNKYLTGSLMNLSTGKRIRVFNSDYNDVVRMMVDKFIDNFRYINWDFGKGKPNPIIGGEEYGIPIADFIARIEPFEGDQEQKRNDLPELLQLLGFPIGGTLRDYLLNALSEKDRVTLYKGLNFILNQIKRDIDPTTFTDDKGGAKRMLRIMAKILQEGDESVDTKMFTNGKNKLISSHTLAGYAIKTLGRLKRRILNNPGRESRREYKDQFLDENDYIFFRDAPIVDWIAQEKKIGLTIKYMDSRKRDDQQEGRELNDMNESSIFVNQYEYWLGGLDKLQQVKDGKSERRTPYGWENGDFYNTWYQLIVPDSTVSYFVEAPALENRVDIANEIHKVWLQEFNRIKWLKDKLAENPDFKSGDANLDQNGLRYHFFPGLENHKVTNWEQAKKHIFGSSDGQIEGILPAAFREYLKKLETANLIKVVKNNIIPLKEFPRSTLFGSVEDTLKMFWYNDFLMRTQLITLLAGDPAIYEKNKTDDLTSVSWQKRVKAYHANGLYLNFENKEFNAAYLYDIKKPSKDSFLKQLEDFLNDTSIPEGFKKAIISNYKEDHNLTDAQGYISLKRWRSIVEALGQWSNKYEDTYNRLSNDENFGPATDADYLLVSQPVKPHYYGPQEREEYKVEVLLKYSAIVLHSGLTKGNPELTALKNQMEAYDLDEVIFESGVKVGKTALLSMEDFLKNGPVKDGVSTIQRLKNEFYKEQQKVPEHFLGDVTNKLGVQATRVMTTNVEKDSIYTRPSLFPEHKRLISIYNKLFNTNKELLLGRDVLKLIDEIRAINIKVDRDNLNDELADEFEFLEKLRTAVLSKNLNSQYTDGLEINSVTGKTRMSLSFPVISRKLEEIFNSFWKKVTNQTHSGGSYVNASVFGFDDDLDIVINKDGSYYVEVAMPLNSNLMGVNVDTGELEKIRDGIVYRIPTEEKYSMFPIRVKKWLDPSAGGVIFMPREVTKIAGLDFDIDKVYALAYNYRVEDGKLVIPRDLKSRQGRENLLLDAWRALLQNRSTLVDFLNVQSIQPLKDIRTRLNLESSTYDGVGYAQSAVKFLINNIIGKNLIAIFANHNSFHSSAEGTNAMVSTQVLQEALSGNLSGYLKKPDIGNLGKTRDYKGNLISKSLAMLISAATDNAKDPVLYDLGINEFTAPVVAFLLHIGIPIEDAIKRVNEDDFKNAYRDANTDTSVEDALTTRSGKLLFNISKEVSKAASLIKVDASRGSTLHDADKIVSDMMNIAEFLDLRGIFPRIGRQDITNNFIIENTNAAPKSTMEYLQVILDKINRAKEHWPYFSPEFINVKSKLMEYMYSYRAMSPSSRRIADVEHMAILHYDLFNIDDSIDLLNDFPERYVKYSANYKKEHGDLGPYSTLFNAFGTKDNKLGFYNKNSYDNASQDKIKSQWESALISGDPELRKIAQDLLKYSFITNGYQFTYDSFMHLVPISFFETNLKFRDFSNRNNYPTQLIAFNIAITNPKKFIKVVAGKFSVQNDQDLTKLESGRSYKDENGENHPYYLPMYAKNIDGVYNIFVADEFIKSGFITTEVVTPSYQQVIWKSPLTSGRTFDFNFEFGDGTLMDSGLLIDSAEKLHIVSSTEETQKPSQVKPKFRIPMNFEDGTGGRKMRPEFRGKSTIELIKEGNRTATSRDSSKSYNKYNIIPGDIIEFYADSGKSKGQNVLVEATTSFYPLSEVSAEEWSRLEGWESTNFEKLKAAGYEQFQYKLFNTATTSAKYTQKEVINILRSTYNDLKLPEC